MIVIVMTIITTALVSDVFECRRDVNFLRALKQQIIIIVKVIIIIKLIITPMMMMTRSYLCHPIENHVDEHKSSRSTNSVTGDHHCVHDHYNCCFEEDDMMMMMMLMIVMIMMTPAMDDDGAGAASV